MNLIDKYPRAFQAIQSMRLGKRIMRACREAGISRAQLIALADADPEVRAALEAAQAEADDVLAEALADPEEWLAFGAQDPAVARIWSENAKWLLTKLRAERYGDKVVVETKTSIDIVITSRLEAAKQRIIEGRATDLNSKCFPAIPLAVPLDSPLPSLDVQDGS